MSLPCTRVTCFTRPYRSVGRGCIFHNIRYGPHGVLSTGRVQDVMVVREGMGPAGEAREGQKGWLGGSLLI